MAQTEVTKEEILAVYPKVAETMADALGCDVEDVKLDVSLIEGLDAESIDFLDMVFRLERAFKIKIPRGKIVENARGDLPEAEFEQKGIVTEKGMAQLRAYLSEIPPERFKTPMKVADIPAAVHARDILQAGGARAARSARGGVIPAAAPERGSTDNCMSAHFAAFSFVDRITEFVAGSRARASFWVPDGIRAFPQCLVAEAVGQLAAWVAMSHVDFRGRPVAALATETRFRGEALTGETLHLAVEIEDCDDNIVAYGGSAAVDGRTIIELEHCLGPMLPVGDFDAPEALRQRLELLRNEGAPRGRFHGVEPVESRCSSTCPASPCALA